MNVPEQKITSTNFALSIYDLATIQIPQHQHPVPLNLEPAPVLHQITDRQQGRLILTAQGGRNTYRRTN